MMIYKSGTKVVEENLLASGQGSIGESAQYAWTPYTCGVLYN